MNIKIRIADTVTPEHYAALLRIQGFSIRDAKTYQGKTLEYETIYYPHIDMVRQALGEAYELVEDAKFPFSEKNKCSGYMLQLKRMAKKGTKTLVLSDKDELTALAYLKAYYTMEGRVFEPENFVKAVDIIMNTASKQVFRFVHIAFLFDYLGEYVPGLKEYTDAEKHDMQKLFNHVYCSGFLAGAAEDEIAMEQALKEAIQRTTTDVVEQCYLKWYFIELIRKTRY